jgi:hypothetical protein
MRHNGAAPVGCNDAVCFFHAPQRASFAKQTSFPEETSCSAQAEHIIAKKYAEEILFS